MINLKIVTPDGSLYESGEVEGVTVNTKGGQIGVYRDHEPIMSVLHPGAIQIEKDGYTQEIVVSGGVIRVEPNSKVVILADTALRAEEISGERIEEAKRRVEEYMKRIGQAENVEFAYLQSQIEIEIAHLDVASRLTHKHQTTIKIEEE